MTEVNGPFMTGKSKTDLENEKCESVVVEASNNKKRKSSTESSNDSKRVHIDTNDIKNIMGHILDEIDKQNVTNATKSLMEGSEDDGKKSQVKEKVSSNEKSSKSPKRRGSQESTTTLTSSTNSSSSSSSSSSGSSSSSSSSSSSDSSDSSDSEQEKTETKAQDVPVEAKPKAKAPVFDPKIGELFFPPLSNILIFFVYSYFYHALLINLSD
jgi:hypothetical protein